MNIRNNFAEGRFYSKDKNEIIKIFEDAIAREVNNIDYSLADKFIIGGVVPHAGHVYCSTQAIHFFEIIKKSNQIFDVVVIVNPNHHGGGLPASIDEHDYWQSPLGKIEVDQELADYIELPEDSLSQAYEHSAEVIIPYIQYFMPKSTKILPISFGAQSRENARVLAHAIFKACVVLNRRVLFIASSDFNHFAAPEEGKALDDYALDSLLNYDSTGFEERIKEKNISICGFGAILSLFYYAKDMTNDFKIKILKQGHSGEVTPMDSVVDYVSILFYKE